MNGETVISRRDAINRVSTTCIEVRQTRSLIGQPQRQRLTVRGLGLRRIGHQVVLRDTPAIRGMIFKVQHLLEVRVRAKNIE